MTRAQAPGRPKLRIWLAPSVDDPYIARLSAALLAGSPEAEVESVDALPPITLGTVRSLEPGRDVVHLQWIEYLYRLPRTTPRFWLRSLIRAVRFVLVIALLRVRGVRVVWTVHNRRSHDSAAPRLDAAVAVAIGRLVSAFVTHSEHAAGALPRLWGKGKRVIVPHGHFVGVYPEVASGDPIRERLGITQEAPVALAFGQIRAYKRYDTLVAGFHALADPDARLVIAGKPVSPDAAATVRSAAAKDPRIVLLDRFVTDEEVAELHAAADVGVFAYDEVFTSGTLITALSLGLPALAPEWGSATEIAGDTPVLVTFGRGEFPARLGEVLRPGAFGDRSASREEAVRVARTWRWEEAAVRLIRDAYLPEQG